MVKVEENKRQDREGNDRSLSIRVRQIEYSLIFLINCFNNVENAVRFDVI